MSKLRHEKSLVADYVSGKEVAPNAFPLWPLEASDYNTYQRLDGAHRAVKSWIDAARSPILYLTGRSGTGKSSILQAWIIPELKREDPACLDILIRSFGEPLQTLSLELLKLIKNRSDIPSDRSLYKPIEQIAKSIFPANLVLIFDQFEEIIILKDDRVREPLLALLSEITENPIEGLLIVIALRSDYQGQLIKLIDTAKLPELRAGCAPHEQTWFEVPLFTEAHARSFFSDRGLKLGERVLTGVIGGSAITQGLQNINERGTAMLLLGLARGNRH